MYEDALEGQPTPRRVWKYRHLTSHPHPLDITSTSSVAAAAVGTNSRQQQSRPKRWRQREEDAVTLAGDEAGSTEMF